MELTFISVIVLTIVKIMVPGTVVRLIYDAVREFGPSLGPGAFCVANSVALASLTLCQVTTCEHLTIYLRHILSTDGQWHCH